MSHKAFLDLAQGVGNFIEYWGFKNIHGQIWTYLYLRDQPVSARELKEELHISKALLSMTLSDLKKYQVVQSVGRGEFGVELLEANPDIVDSIIQVIQGREKQLVAAVSHKLQALKKINKDTLERERISLQRLQKLEKFVHFASRAIESIIKLETVRLSPWRRFRHSPKGGRGNSTRAE